MAVTAWKAAGTCSSDSAVGSIQWFADVFNNTSLAGTEVSSDNNVNAESQPTSGATSHYLKCTNFGFTSSDVPTGATIDGIEWRFSRYRNAVPTVATTNCKLVKAGSFVGSTVTVTADWPTSETSATMGGATELGGQSWTQSDVTASNFGVGISYTCNTTRFFPSSASHFIDIVEVRVHYTAGAGGVGTAFGQLKFQSNVVAFSKRTAGTAFAQLKFTSKVVTNKISNVTQQYGLGDNLNIASMTTDAPLLRDNSAGDNTTYYGNGPTGATTAISAYFDLGSAKQVGRLRFRYGFQDVGSWTFYASNDGTSWTDAWTGLPPTSGFSFCSFNWEAEHNATSITSTSYRYWRLVVKDTLSDCSVTEVRLGDYRIYDTSDVEYVPGSGGGGPTYKYGTAVATTAITASVRVAKIKIRRAFSQVVISSTTRAVRVRMRGTLSQVRVQATARVIKIETRQARASLVVSAQARVSKVEIRQARASLVVVAQALVSKVEIRSAFANLVLIGTVVGTKSATYTALASLSISATSSVVRLKTRSSFVPLALTGSVVATNVKTAVLGVIPLQARVQYFTTPQANDAFLWDVGNAVNEYGVTAPDGTLNCFHHYADATTNVHTSFFTRVSGTSTISGQIYIPDRGVGNRLTDVIAFVTYSDITFLVVVLANTYDTWVSFNFTIPDKRLLNKLLGFRGRAPGNTYTGTNNPAQFDFYIRNLVIQSDNIQADRIKTAKAYGSVQVTGTGVFTRPKYAVAFGTSVVTSNLIVSKVKSTIANASIRVNAVSSANRIHTRSTQNSLRLLATSTATRIRSTTANASLRLLSNASTVRLKTRQALATIIIVATATSVKIEVRSLVGQLRITASAIPIRLKNQTVRATMVVGATSQTVRIKSRSTVGTLVLDAKVTGTKGGRQRIYFIT
jgi:hypothetical protein